MRNTSLKLTLMALVAVALVALTAPVANASPVAYTLSSTSGSNTITVSYTFDSSTDALVVTGFNLNGLGLDGGKLLSVGVDNGATLTSLPSGWALDSATPNCDGLSHSCNLYSGPANVAFSSSLTFTVSGSPTNIFFHIGGFNNTSCSVWVGGAFASNVSNGVESGLGDCGGTPTVPEPGTLGLMGTGLIGLAGLFRRRFLS